MLSGMDLAAIQQALRAHSMDAWLFYDHHHRDPIAYRVLGLSPELMVTRRWYYLIPAHGEPRKLVHRVEPGHLDSLPGVKEEYSAWSEMQEKLRALTHGCRRIAMQYSPDNQIPYVSLVDAGTVELIRSFGPKVVTSADLITRFEAVWTPQQFATHGAAGRVIDAAIPATFQEIRRRLDSGQPPTEYEMQQWLVERMQAGGLLVEEPPIVAVDAHAGNPHYEPARTGSATIREDQLVLLDVWGKLNQPGAVYYDVTWMGYTGPKLPKRIEKVFNLVRDARDAAISFVENAIPAGQRIQGWEVDRVARSVIEAAGYGPMFVHRTGHSIGEQTHGNGPNMDNLETHDEREIIPNVCFSIEPGIYLPEFGVRLEVNMFVGEGTAEVTGPVQRKIVTI